MTHELHDDRQPGWYYVDNALLDEYGPKIGALGIAVYSTLARYANKARVSWPSYSTMADALKLSRPTVIATVRVLVEHGLVEVETIKKDGKRPYNLYTLIKVTTIPTGKADEPVKDIYQSTGKADLLVKDVVPTGKADEPVMVKDVYSNKTQLTRPNKQEEIPPVTTVTSPRGDAVMPKIHEQRFERFWERYPKKKQKGAALQWWTRNKPDDGLLATMLCALDAARASPNWRKEGGRYIPNPATWLHNLGWLDETEISDDGSGNTDGGHGRFSAFFADGTSGGDSGPTASETRNAHGSLATS